MTNAHFVAGAASSSNLLGLRGRIRKTAVGSALLAAVVGATLSASAATLIWDPTHQAPGTPAGGPGTWDLAGLVWDNAGSDTNWTDTSAAGVDLAVFTGTGGAVALNTNLSALGLQFTVPGYTISGTGNLTLGASGIDASAVTSGTTTLGNAIILAGIQNWNAGAGSTLAVTGNVSGVAANVVTLNGLGTVVLSGTNSFVGGVTLNSGTLDVNSTTAIGTGKLTIGGGTLDTTLANDTLTTNNIETWSGDFTYNGTGNLTLGTGAVTMSGGTRTVTVNGNTLSVGAVTNTTGGLTLNGTGTLATGGSNNIAGNLTLNGSTLLTSQDLHVAGLLGNGTVRNSNAAAGDKWFFVTETSNQTFSGTISGGLSKLGLNFTGPGKLTLTGPNVIDDAVNINSGTVVFSGSHTNTTQGDAVGETAGTNAVLILPAGVSFLSNDNTGQPYNSSMNISTNATAAGSVQNNGATFLTNRQLAVGPTGYGAFSQTAGNSTVGGFLAVGGTAQGGVVNISGGTLTLPTGDTGATTVGYGGSNAATYGVLNVSGSGAYVNNANAGLGLWIGEVNNGILNVTGNGTVTITSAGTVGGGGGLMLGKANGVNSNGTVNADGGTIVTPFVSKGTGTGTFNFNGGTLKANANATNFMSGLTNAYVYSGGATIDDGGNIIAIAQPLLAPTGQGVSTAGLTFSGTGFIDTPVITVTGGTGGFGATAVAVIDSNGNLTNVIVTNPGSGYTAAPIFAIVGGGRGNTGSITGTATLVNDVSGGLTKNGAGVTTLTGASTYTGVTTVNAGSLVLTTTGSINNSSGVTVAGGKFVQAASAPVTPVVTVSANGTLDGTSTVNTVIVNTGGTVANGNGGTGALTVGSLTFKAAGNLSLNVGSTSPELITTTLSTSNGGGSSTGKVTVNATDALWSPGVYDLVSYSTLSGPGFSDFLKGTISGLSNRQSATLTNVPGFIALTIAGDNPVWTGKLSGNWTTAVQASPKNWALITSGTPTDYVQGDVVTFDDTATGTTTVSISDANVSPTSVTFNNNNLAYSIGGPFGIAGNATVKVNGTGMVSLSAPSTYTGGTTVNSGTLNINSASAIGTGNLTINGGTIDNTSGAPVILSTANPQNWNADFTYGGTYDLNLGTGAVALPAARVITTNGTANLTVGGTISGVGIGITKLGPGSLVFTGNNTYSGTTIISGGSLTVAGGVTGTLTTSGNSDIQISPNAADTGVLVVTGGVVNDDRMIIGGNSPNGGTPGNGQLTQTGGVINSQQWFTVGSGVATGASSPTGEYDISGGTMNLFAQQMEVANFAGTTGIVNMSGNTTAINLYSNTSIAMGANALAGDGTFTQSGGNVTFYSDAGITPGGNGILYLGKAGSLAGTYTYNLNGGTLTVPQIQETAGSGGTGVFNFNGGILKAAKPNANWMAGIDQASVGAGGAIIDDGGYAVTIAQTLISGGGVDGGLTHQGNGTLTLSGANGYTGPTIQNAGNLVLTGANTYSGQTTVNAGTLLVSGTGSINGSSGVQINGGKFSLTSSTALTPTVTVGNGTLNGSNATLSTVVVSSGSGVVANGVTAGDSGVLTIGSLTFNGNGTLNVTLAGPTDTTSPGIVTTTFATSGGGGKVALNVVNSTWNTGAYDMVGYSTRIGVINDIVLGTVTGLTPRQGATLSATATDLVLTVSAGNVPIWTGALNSNWTTAVLAAPKNWKLQTGGATTDFLTGDTVLFDDTAVTKSVNISDANVSPTSTTFNNNTSNYTISSTGGFGIATGFLVKGGNGTVSLNTANSYAGGTTLNVGTLNVNTTTAIGTGTLTINGGSLDNTSGAAITLTTNNPASVNGDFTYVGSNSLNLGTGNVTLGGTGTVRTIAVNAGTLTMGGIPVATGYGLTKTGAGTLILSSGFNLSGPLALTVGNLGSSGQDGFASGLSGNGTFQNYGTGTSTLHINTTTDSTFAGTLQDGTAGGIVGLSKTGTANLTLTGNNNYSGATNVAAGTLTFSGTSLNTAALDTVGGTAGANAILVVSSGSTFGANWNGGQFTSSLAIGANATAAGDVRVNSNATLSVAEQLGIGTGSGGYAALSSAGNTTVGSFVVVGFGGDSAVLNVSNGSLTVGSNLITIAAGNTASTGIVNLTGGNSNSTATTGYGPTIGGTFVGEFGNGTLNVSGNATLALSGWGLRLAHNTGAVGQVNLDGGVVTTTAASQGGGTGTLNFNGGTLKSSGNTTGFLQGITNTYVYMGGAVIDDGGNNITINQALIAPTGGGVTNSGLSYSGGGYIDQPIVTITGDGTGAAAVATISANGTLTGITITNPGVNYTTASFALSGGGIGNTGSVTGTPSIVANVSGGFTKLGSGSVTLTAANTYAGTTTISNGTLFVNNTTGSGTGTGNVLLNGGTLGGNGAITGAVSGAGTINPGATALTVGTLTIGGLSTNANTTLSFDLASPTGTNDLLAVAGNVTLAGGKLAISSQSTTGNLSLGYYKVLSYTGNLTGSTSGIVLPAIANNVEYTLDSTHDLGFIDVHRGFIGDADDNGIVDVNDLKTVLSNLGTTSSSWLKGNFDGAATIDLNDLDDVLNNLNVSIPTGASIVSFSEALVAAPSSTPEPTSLGILALGAGALLARRRKA